jgi:alcohol dehydrogenase
MLAVTTRGDGSVELTDVPRPTIEASDDVIVRVTAAAICGTDLHFVRRPLLPPGATLGHEFLGVVDEVGPEVEHFSVGQRVLSKMFVSCGRCRACRTGNQPRCPGYQLFGGGVLGGGQAGYVRVPRADRTLSLLEESVSDAEALTLTDILPTAWEALERARFTSGETLSIIGSGPVGLLVAQVALARGAAQVYVVDFDETRLARAGDLGATPVMGGASAVEDVLRATGGRGVDIAVDAVGSVAAIETAQQVVAAGGSLALVGVVAQGDLGLKAEQIWTRHIDVLPVTGNPYTSNDLLEAMIRAGRIDPGSVIDHEAPLSAAVETYAAFADRQFTKAILRP